MDSATVHSCRIAAGCSRFWESPPPNRFTVRSTPQKCSLQRPRKSKCKLLPPVGWSLWHLCIDLCNMHLIKKWRSFIVTMDLRLKGNPDTLMFCTECILFAQWCRARIVSTRRIYIQQSDQYNLFIRCSNDLELMLHLFGYLKKPYQPYRSWFESFKTKWNLLTIGLALS